ncbi:hypothetical protein [Pelagibius sp.]|uniref:hypothetical protein n=1 Tax=Pelagibius sp. TaxID=1931238 RepID=UPI003BAE4DD9
MRKATLTTTIAASALAFALAACDQQQADSGDVSSEPMQQQGAVPESPAATSSEPSAVIPGTAEPDSTQPEAMQPDATGSDTQSDLPTPAETTQ